MLYWRAIDPTLLEPQFHLDVESIFGADPADWFVIYGYRTGLEQQQLYQKYLAGGPKAAAPGLSAHEFGLAIDVVLDARIGDGGKLLVPDYDTTQPAWQRVFAKILAHPRLHSGRSFGDADHVEKLNWMLYKDWKTQPWPGPTGL